MDLRVKLVSAAALTLVVFGCAGERTTDAKDATQSLQTDSGANSVELLPSPAGAGAAEPFLAATADGVVLSWLEPVAGTDRVALRFARYSSQEWSAPRSIVERNDLFVNWADFPSIVEDARGALFAHWLQISGEGTYSYDVRMATSTDRGETWSEPFLVNRDGKQAEHGFVTLSPLPDGGVGATWLDGRAMSGGGHGHGESGGDMSLRYAKVAADGSITEDVELDERTCECCTTGMTVTASGPLVVYRDRSADEVRDIAYVVKTAGGWTRPARVNADEWKINACPVNGPQIDAMGKQVVTAWFTAAQDKAKAFVSFSEDGGHTFGKTITVDDGRPVGRMDVVMLDEETALVTWLEQTAGGGEIRARKVSRKSGPAPSLKIAASSTARAAGFARIARSGKEVYFAWTEQDAKSKLIRVSRLTL